MNCKQAEVLITGYLDQELTQQESQDIRVHMDTCESCKKLYADMKVIQEQMGELSYPKADDEVLAEIEQDLTAKATSGAGWVLLILGFIILCGIGFYTFFTAPDMSTAEKFFHGLFLSGGILLFISVLRQRLLTYKNDKYRKVKL